MWQGDATQSQEQLGITGAFIKEFFRTQQLATTVLALHLTIKVSIALRAFVLPRLSGKS
jgi:hypothetical protein